MKAAFYKGTRPGLAGLYNIITKWWGNGKYSHCELIFSDGMAASSSFADGGVRFKRIEFSPDRWDFIKLSDELEADARAWFEAHAGQKYDLRGNVRFVLDFLRDDKDKWFCSEAKGAALGIKEPWRLDPNNLFQVLTWRFGQDRSTVTSASLPIISCVGMT